MAVLAAVAVSVSVLVAGCTQDAGPKPSPLPSTTKSASPSSTAPTPPVMPAEAKGRSAKSAKAFVRYYVATLNYATATGDSKRLRGLDDGDCRSCAGIEKRIDDVYGPGGRIDSAGWKITSLALVADQPKAPLVDVGLSLPPQNVTKRAGQKPVKFKGGRLLVTFRLTSTANGWIVNEWARAA